MQTKFTYLGIFAVLAFLMSCECDPEPCDFCVDLTDISYNPTPYELDVPDYFPALTEKADNPLTVDGVQLGRHLFYDPILSADSTMSCFSCHNPKKAFTDAQEVSFGIDNIPGRRSSMTLVNIGFVPRHFFWDGRSESLEDQALLPVVDPIELHDEWPNVETKLKRSGRYRTLFRKAFGIDNSKAISRDLAAKALAQFQRILISSNAKFDKVFKGRTFFSPEEQDGFDMFFDTSSVLPDAECGHCHNFPLFDTDEFFNNGIDSVASLQDFEDLGRGEVTEYEFDNGKFRAPSLRNIALTAPYMHDGRFKTLDEVLDHYNSGGHPSPNKDPLIMDQGLGLDNAQKQSLIAFLKTLTDTSYLENPDVLSPF